MNRRSFLVRLGLAAAGAAAMQLLDDDPDRLIWTPGAKTIVDFGATKQVLPATDADVLQQARWRLFDYDGSGCVVYGGGSLPGFPGLPPVARDVRLDLFTGGSVTSFHYQDNKLVSLHSAEELALLDKPLFPIYQPGDPRIARARAEYRAGRRQVDYSGIMNMPEEA